VDAVRFGELSTAFMSTVTNGLETADRIPGLLVGQLTAPVRFTQAVQELIAQGVGTFVEVGPGGVLTGLVKRIDPSVRALSISTAAELAVAQEVTAGA
jgi:[acyl-carrier-protein] S-malonyltransferase